MDNQNLLEYIAQARHKGLSDDEIKQNLLSSGWLEESINKALNPPKKGMAVLMYFGIGILISLFTGNWRDPFVKFHLKQGIIFYIVSIVLDIVSRISEFALDKSDAKTSLIYSSVGLFVYLAIFAVGIRGIANAATGKINELPIIGGLAQWLKF